MPSTWLIPAVQHEFQIQLVAFSKHGWCAFSPFNEIWTSEKNSEVDLALKNYLRRSGFRFTPFYCSSVESSTGKQGERFEKAYVVYNYRKDNGAGDFSKLVEQMEATCSEFGKETFLAVPPEAPAVWMKSDGSILETLATRSPVEAVLLEFFVARLGHAPESASIFYPQPGTMNGRWFCDIVGQVYSKARISPESGRLEEVDY